jgi:hypothetical protein
VTRCRHDMEMAWCGDCKAAKARRRGSPAGRTRTRKAASAKGVRSQSNKGGKTAPELRSPIPVKRASALPTRKAGPRQGSSSATGSAPAATSDAGSSAKTLKKRQRGLLDAETALAKAQRTGVGLAAARERISRAKQRLLAIEQALGRAAAPRPAIPGRAPKRADPSWDLEHGCETAPPHLDPDLAAGLVWVLPHGKAFHRRDCHIVDTRDSALSLTRAKARALALERCQLCSPLA